MAFQLPDLPYAYDALEPSIDQETMKLHHDKHHAGYTSKLNDAVKGTEWENKPIEELLSNLDQLPKDKQSAVRNNGGGFYNHKLFWPTLGKPGGDGGGEPTGELGDAINETFGSYSDFKDKFKTAATGRFGSGWAWLCVNPQGKLHITSTANQDTTFMPESFGGHGKGHQPILGLDVWEHAYYKKYGPGRADYVDAFWDVVNWSKVAENYADAKK